MENLPVPQGFDQLSLPGGDELDQKIFPRGEGDLTSGDGNA